MTMRNGSSTGQRCPRFTHQHAGNTRHTHSYVLSLVCLSTSQVKPQGGVPLSPTLVTHFATSVQSPLQTVVQPLQKQRQTATGWWLACQLVSVKDSVKQEDNKKETRKIKTCCSQSTVELPGGLDGLVQQGGDVLLLVPVSSTQHHDSILHDTTDRSKPRANEQEAGIWEITSRTENNANIGFLIITKTFIC